MLDHPMKELKDGLLMLLVCIACHLQSEPRFWHGLIASLGHLFGLTLAS
jgi:hypothetical protein